MMSERTFSGIFSGIPCIFTGREQNYVFRIRIFIVRVQVYKEICLTVHSRKQNKQ